MTAFWAGRRVLVTGHTGFKGAWLCLWLERLGATVSGLALPPQTKPSLYELASPWTEQNHRTVDIRDSGRRPELRFGTPRHKLSFTLPRNRWCAHLIAIRSQPMRQMLWARCMCSLPRATYPGWRRSLLQRPTRSTRTTQAVLPFVSRIGSAARIHTARRKPVQNFLRARFEKAIWPAVVLRSLPCEPVTSSVEATGPKIALCQTLCGPSPRVAKLSCATRMPSVPGNMFSILCPAISASLNS